MTFYPTPNVPKYDGTVGWSIIRMRREHEGKLYIYLKDQETGERFLEEAQLEGYRFGKVEPKDSHWSDLVAVEEDRQLSYVGSMGRTAVQAGFEESEYLPYNIRSSVQAYSSNKDMAIALYKDFVKYLADTHTVWLAQ